MKIPARRQHRFWRAFYDRAAFAYDPVMHAGAWLRVGSENRIRGEVIAAVQIADGARPLEIGCGTAANRAYLPRNVHYVGLDISRGMLSLAKRQSAKLQLHSEFVQADATALPFKTGAADMILAMGVLQHAADAEAAIREIYRVGKTKGQALIIDERRSQARLLKALGGQLVPHAIGEYFTIHLPID